MKSSLIYIPAAQFISFTLYLVFFMEDQEPILGHYSWQNPFETSQRSEKSEAPTHG